MTRSGKQKKLQKIVEENYYVTILLDALREGEKITGVRFDGRLIYKEEPSLPGKKDQGYFLQLKPLPCEIRLFSKELTIRKELGDYLLLSFTNSETRGTLRAPKIIGRKDCYGLIPEYADPRKNFPDRIVEIVL